MSENKTFSFKVSILLPFAAPWTTSPGTVAPLATHPQLSRCIYFKFLRVCDFLVSENPLFQMRSHHWCIDLFTAMSSIQIHLVIIEILQTCSDAFAPFPIIRLMIMNVQFAVPMSLSSNKYMKDFLS